MKTSLRYKIALWMVWVQLALLPLTIYMKSFGGYPFLWRWNLLNWIIITGYAIGLFALPISRKLEKPKILRLWLRVDFILSLLFLLPFASFMYNEDWITVRATSGKFVLYQHHGFLLHSEVLRLGEKHGIFIRALSKNAIYSHYKQNIDEFGVDTVAGCFYGYGHGEISVAWVLPLDRTMHHPDTMRYQKNARIINRLIETVYAAQPMGNYSYCSSFVFPDHFAGIRYEDKEIFYKDSVMYHIDYEPEDSVIVSKWQTNSDNIPMISFPKHSMSYMSPDEVREFITNLERRVAR